MSNRVHANARIAEDIFDLHAKHVQEKHAADSLYKGVEAELALREYLDQDHLASVEQKLRDRCRSLGCSPAKIKRLVTDADNTTKKKAQWRIRSELKEDVKTYAKETNETYSDVFAVAIREYWTNSRANRLEALVDRLTDAIDPWTEQIGSDGVNATVKDRRTAEIAMEVGEQSEFTRDELEDAIADVTSPSDYNKREYTPLVAAYKGVEEHPKTEELFIPHERAAELREHQDDESGPDLLDQSVADLTSDERVRRVQARLYRDALSGNGKTAMVFSEIAAEFNDELGKTTVYTLMDNAATLAGYETASPHGTKRLQVTAREVDDTDVIEAASVDEPQPAAAVSAEMGRIAGAEAVQ